MSTFGKRTFPHRYVGYYDDEHSAFIEAEAERRWVVRQKVKSKRRNARVPAFPGRRLGRGSVYAQIFREAIELFQEYSEHTEFMHKERVKRVPRKGEGSGEKAEVHTPVDNEEAE